ncbi:hypothetical protein PWT90_05364 [Aphanocladium album]|nr:hypothetical protein PWT90_05364 [Aphanocladium album]
MDGSMAFNRRFLAQSEDSQVSAISEGLQVDIDATNRLSDLLDKQRGKIFETELTNFSSKDVLRRFLSLRSVISTASSFALQNQDMTSQQTGYRRIGFGQCGLIFERPGRNFVLKLARPHFEEALWNDCLSHQRAYQVFTEQASEPECRVPLLYNYVKKANAEWWNANAACFSEVSEDFPLPTSVLITERIAPLPRPIRHALIDEFCPPALKDTVLANSANRDCLVRIYLGRRRDPNAPPPPNFSLRNYNLCLDQMVALGLPVQLYASAMAEALALMHWSAFMDAYDVEFVLGSEIQVEHTRPMADYLFWKRENWKTVPSETDIDSIMRADFRKRPTRMWLLDFNLCSLWTEETVLKYSNQVISQLVLAFFENDPYYPLPLMELELDKELWGLFKDEYLRKSEALIQSSSSYEQMKGLPARFIKECVIREQGKLDRGLGHGHRDLKG